MTCRLAIEFGTQPTRKADENENDMAGTAIRMLIHCGLKWYAVCTRTAKIVTNKLRCSLTMAMERQAKSTRPFEIRAK